MKIKNHLMQFKNRLMMAALLATPFVASAVTNVVYQDDFSGSSSTNLLGTTTDVGGGVWTSSGASAPFKADGSVTNGASGIWLPVTIEAGNIYILSAEITQPVASSDWISLGYAQNNPDSAFYSAAGYGTIFVAGWGGGQANGFAGVNLDGSVGSTAGGDNGKQLDIVLDATNPDSANWTMQFYVDGVELGTGPYTVGSGNYESIAYVGFSATTSGSIDNFRLSMIPDPNPDLSIETLYEDDFSGGVVDLRGSTTDVGGGVWTNAGTASNFNADGSVVTNAAASGIWLPVHIEAGKVYTLSAEITQPIVGGDWISLGYVLNNPDDAYYGAGPFGNIFVSGWGGGNANGILEGTNIGATAGGDNGKRLKIVLDASSYDSANWTMQFYTGGVELGTGPYTAASADFGDIAYIGFSTVNGYTSGTIDNFKLSVRDPSYGIDVTYENWAVAYGLTAGVNDDPLYDAENGGMGDGVDNLLEYTLGGIPLVDDAADLLPTTYVADDGGTSGFYYIQSRRTEDPALSHAVLLDDDLVSAPAGVTNAPIGQSAEVNGFTTFTNRTDVDKSAEFFKLKVQMD